MARRHSVPSSVDEQFAGHTYVHTNDLLPACVEFIPPGSARKSVRERGGQERRAEKGRTSEKARPISKFDSSLQDNFRASLEAARQIIVGRFFLLGESAPGVSRNSAVAAIVATEENFSFDSADEILLFSFSSPPPSRKPLRAISAKLSSLVLVSLSLLPPVSLYCVVFRVKCATR